jgi:surfeit locus 1 family protein
MIKPRRWLAVTAALLSIALTARLGVWQLDRAQQKRDRQALIDARQHLPPLETAELSRLADQAEQQHHRRIRLQGRWSPEHTVYLDNRQMAGRPGFFVLTPLVLQDGVAVLVQRGWMPRNFLDRNALAPVPTPGGWVELLGRVAPPPARLLEFSKVASGSIRQNLDLVSFAGETGLRLAPAMVLQLEPVRSAADVGAAVGVAGDSGQRDGLQRDWPAPAVDIGKHHGYAFQWFALSALLGGLLLWFQIILPFLQRSRP